MGSVYQAAEHYRNGRHASARTIVFISIAEPSSIQRSGPVSGDRVDVSQVRRRNDSYSLGKGAEYLQARLPETRCPRLAIDVNLRRFRPRLTQKTRQSGLPRQLTRAWVAMIGVLFANYGPGPALS